jgi:DNA-binding transcriptional regulator YhcF (GntR family)
MLTQPKGWRALVPVHAAAEFFPLMTQTELRELADDIKKHGQREAVIVYNDQKIGPCLLDGRNRLDAWEKLGRKITYDDPTATNRPPRNGKIMVASPTFPRIRISGEPEFDPYAYAISRNVCRRHLTNEQKRELVAKVLKARPEVSDRQIAEEVKVSHPTVGKVRAELEQHGDVEKLTTSTDTKGRQQPRKRKANGGMTMAAKSKQNLDWFATACREYLPHVTVERHREEARRIVAELTANQKSSPS